MFGGEKRKIYFFSKERGSLWIEIHRHRKCIGPRRGKEDFEVFPFTLENDAESKSPGLCRFQIFLKPNILLVLNPHWFATWKYTLAFQTVAMMCLLGHLRKPGCLLSCPVSRSGHLTGSVRSWDLQLGPADVAAEVTRSLCHLLYDLSLSLWPKEIQTTPADWKNKWPGMSYVSVLICFG